MNRIHFDNRKSGIPSIGVLPWGTHFCLFYQTKEDILSILVPYFRAGLENNELCIWVTSSPITVAEATDALRQTITDFKRYMEKGQIEVTTDIRWRNRGRTLDGPMISALDRAVAGGFNGVRFSRNTVASGKSACAFTDQETDAVARNNVLALLVYPRRKVDAVGLMEIVKRHRFALVRNAGTWEVIESSEARIIKNALRASEEKLSSVFSNMSEGFAYHRIVLDAGGKPCDYVFLEINEVFERLTGLRAEGVIGKKATDVLPGIENDPARWIEKYGDVALTGKPMRFENYSEALQRWYSISAFSWHRGYFAATFFDITESKLAERALRDSEMKYRNLFENMAEEVHFWKVDRDDDGRIVDGRLVDANPPALATWGKTLDEIKGKTTDEIFGPGALEHYLPIVQKTMTEGVPYSYEDYFPNLDKYFRFISVPFGEYFITTGADITAVKKAQKLAEQHQVELEAANKDLESFSYSVSHDLRAPLRAIDGFSRILLREHGEKLDAEGGRLFNIIRKNALDMGQLIDDLLAFSHLGRQPVNLDEIDMVSLAQNVYEELQRNIPERSTAFAVKALPPARGDRAMIRQVLVNLLSNAMKFSRDRADVIIEVSGRTEGDENIYYVKDNGIGFDMQYADKLFGVFQRLHTSDEFEGTGVGLAIVRRTILKHGGRVWAEAKVNEGATLYFSLPR